MSYKTENIKKVIENLNDIYFLPAIQREFVWDENRITNLFDSLMRGYPIGSFLFWEIPKNEISKCRFYEFINYFDERDNFNEEANFNGRNSSIISVLDGQQRLTSLFIGLKGSLTIKKLHTRDKYKKKKLYLNLSKINESDDIENQYLFEFKEGVESNDALNHWFEVGNILNLDHDKIDDYIDNTDLSDKKLARSILRKLRDLIFEKELINYYLEDSKDIDRVLNIFIRINSGGEKLRFSDLLLSVLTAYFKKIDIKKSLHEFVQKTNDIGNFNIDKDFVLKSFLFMLDETIKFKIDNFTKESVLSGIEDNFDSLCDAINNACILLKEMGFSKESLSSNYPITVIAYRLYKAIKPSIDYDERREIKMFVIKSSWIGLFGGSTDVTLETIRKSMQQNSYIINCDNFKIYIAEDSIPDNVLKRTYPRNKGFLFQMLFLLYPSFDFRNNFHLDHIYPQSFFTKKELKKIFSDITDKKVEELWKKCNTIANLQLLKANGSTFNNLSKNSSMPEDWLNKEFGSNLQDINNFKGNNLIPTDYPLKIDNFERFIEDRSSKIISKLTAVLIGK